jgi:hypothetical protein
VTTKDERRPGRGAASKAIDELAATVAPCPGDGYRSWRIRRWARRQLDGRAAADPWQHAEPADWHTTGMTLGMRERDLAGAELGREARGHD